LVKISLLLLGRGSIKMSPWQRVEEMLDMSFSVRSVSYQGKLMISYSQNFFFQNKESSLKMKSKNKTRF
jgi:hypothetical protein